MKTQKIAKFGSLFVLTGVFALTIGCRGGNGNNNGNNTATAPINPTFGGSQFPGGFPGGGQVNGVAFNGGGQFPMGQIQGSQMGGYGQVMATAYGQAADSSIGLGLSIYGTPTQGGAAQAYAQGELVVGQNAYSQSCPILPGYYQVGSSQAGYMAGQNVSNLYLVAQGQTQYGVSQIYMVTGNNRISMGGRYSPSGGTYQATFMGDVYIYGVVINGQSVQCNQYVSTFTLM